MLALALAAGGPAFAQDCRRYVPGCKHPAFILDQIGAPASQDHGLRLAQQYLEPQEEIKFGVQRQCVCGLAPSFPEKYKVVDGHCTDADRPAGCITLNHKDRKGPAAFAGGLANFRAVREYCGVRVASTATSRWL